MEMSKYHHDKLRGYVKNLSGDKRGTFITKYKGLADNKKTVVLNRLFGSGAVERDTSLKGFGEIFQPYTQQQGATIPGLAPVQAAQGLSEFIKGRAQTATAPLYEPPISQIPPSSLQQAPVTSPNIPFGIGEQLGRRTQPQDVVRGLVEDVLLDPKTYVPFVHKAMGKRGGGVLDKVSKFLKRSGVIHGKRGPQEIAEMANRGSTKVYNAFKEEYDTLFSKIRTGKTGSANLVTTLEQNLAAYPEGTQFSKMTKVLNRVKKLKSISAEQLQNLKQEVGKTIKWRGQSDSMNRARKQIYYEINRGLENIGGKEYTGLSSKYKAFKEMVEEVDSVILQRGKPTDIRLRGESPWNIMSLLRGGRLSTPQTEALAKLSKALPKDEQFFQLFEAWKRNQLLKGAGIGTLLAGAAYGARRKVGETIIPGGGID